MDQQAVWQTVRTWSVEDQIEFVSRLWDQIVASGWQPDLTDELKAELDRRIASCEADPTNVATWEQLVTSPSRAPGTPAPG